MIRRARVKSLAKINLDLRVLHRRSDDFHELRTVFQTISLADAIDIEYQRTRRTELSIDDPLAIPDNLVLRAGGAVLDELGLHARVSFRLRKRIPMGGGLGGGSSNAAAVLLTLPVLAGKAIPLERLCALGSALGSDVPFFLLGGTAVGVGRGTEIYPLPELTAEPILVVSPGVHVATGPAYQALGLGLTAADSSRKLNSFCAFVSALGCGRSTAAESFGANDFEAVVFRQYPQLKTLAGKLRKLGAGMVRMTGSGSAIFGVFGSREQRELAAAVLKQDRGIRRDSVMPAALVSRRSYQRLWRVQLREHLNATDKDLWPPQSRYEAR
jgi:4-diphosphocytidyl-2-C-methyl-D-erythritol kinase